MQSFSRREIAAWLAVILIAPIALVSVFVLVSSEFERDADLSRLVQRSSATRGDIAELLSIHQDLETGQRGYLLTDNATFLEPYSDARSRLDGMFLKVEDSVGTSPELERLKTLSHQKLAFVDRTIGLARNGQGAQAIDMVSDGRGMALMDGIRDQIAAIEAAEARRMADRTETAEASRTAVRRIVFALFAGLAILLLTAVMTSLRATGSRNAATRRYRDISARQEAIFENAQDGIVTINPSGSIESANRAVAEMTGYDPQDLLRRDIGLLFEVAPDEGRGENFVRRLARQRREGRGGTIELWGRRADGSRFPCDVAVSSVPLESGPIYVAIVRDTTERKRVDQMKSEFVSTVSHELRTPLTSIAGSLGLLSGGAAGSLPDKAARLIQIARGNCERLVRLINDILDMEKIESGKMEMRLEPMALGPFLEQVVQDNQGYADAHGVALELAPVSPNASVMGDRDRLMQVLTNLVSNAVKFSAKGQTVRIVVTPLDRRWRIDVIDEGSGIPEAFRPRIFGKFAQADGADSRQKGGTGLGLSIVKEIVIRHGGAVSFTSAEGEGTTFHTDLPAHGWTARPYAPRTGAPRVLHVEDDPDVLSLVADSLQDRYAVETVQTLAGARAALAERHYDIVILDYALPDGSGKDLIPTLNGRRTPIVVFTAQDDGQSSAPPVDAVLVKSRASLVTLVDTLDRRIAEQIAAGDV
ncbi:ATP-binding protein [Croceicoccus naphthovorans]|uniref:ATP-binding protein n=1 Tax=Croceicoccus naphthovorans TaxID=1348774 RepID=UPI00069E52AB|nr:ATP-binding protein [Croceicoccus naphthovorans]MBB3988920.1 PAS domain S-box-containing protein [Croceicoccus naphthovorans]